MRKRTTAARTRTRRAPSGQQDEWQLQDAKARFSEVFRLARTRGPQRITRHGKEAVVVVPAEDFERLRARKRQESLVEFFQNSPLARSGINLDRDLDYGRPIKL